MHEIAHDRAGFLHSPTGLQQRPHFVHQRNLLCAKLQLFHQAVQGISVLSLCFNRPDLLRNILVDQIGARVYRPSTCNGTPWSARSRIFPSLRGCRTVRWMAFPAKDLRDHLRGIPCFTVRRLDISNFNRREIVAGHTGRVSRKRNSPTRPSLAGQVRPSLAGYSGSASPNKWFVHSDEFPTGVAR